MLQDLKFALRTFRRSPAFAAVAAITLALGIGANAAIFSVVDSVVLRPLPYPEGDQLVVVEKVRTDAMRARGGGNVSFPDFDDWRKQNKVFSGTAGYHGDALVLTGYGPAQRLDGEVVSANFFDVLGVQPALGRNFAAGEDVDGRNRVAIFSHGAWKKLLGGDRDIIGRSVTLDDTPYTVIGVMPEGFRLVVEEEAIDIYVPMPRAFDRELADKRGAHYMNVLARLRPGVSLEEANANLGVIGASLAAAYPDSNAGRTALATRVQDRLTRNVRPALLILLGAVGFVLLIACANVANLLLARASVRQREMAVRVALGASRGRLVRQLLTESVILALAGAILGVGLATWGLEALRTLIPPDIARFRDLAIDGRVLAFTAAVALATGIIFGLIPALQASGHDPGETLRETGTRSVHGPRQRIRSLFVVAEVAVATVLLVGAGLMLRSFQRVSSVDPGFKPDRLLVGAIMLPETRYDGPEKIRAFYRDFTAGLQALPGTEAVTTAVEMPYSGFNMSFRFTIVGEPEPPPDKQNAAAHHIVHPSYFKTLGIPLRAGRLFTSADDDEKAAPTIIVNETFARRFFAGKNPIGQRLVVNWRAPKDVQKEIIGVVADVRGQGLDAEPGPQMYVPFNQAPFNVVMFAVRTAAPAGMAEALRRTLAAVDGDLPLDDVDPMSKLMAGTLAQRRLNTLLLAVFGAVALLLAVIGVYGVMSYTVTQRVPEIGIRMALGARPGDVVRMVVGHGVLLAAVGVAAGVGGALALSRLVAGLLWGVSATDPLTYAGIATALVVVAVLASWLPARRAARVDPMLALRSE